MRMTPQEMKEAMVKLAMSQSDLARALDVRPETVHRWIAGKHPIPGPAGRLVAELLKRSQPA